MVSLDVTSEPRAASRTVLVLANSPARATRNANTTRRLSTGRPPVRPPFHVQPPPPLRHVPPNPAIPAVPAPMAPRVRSNGARPNDASVAPDSAWSARSSRTEEARVRERASRHRPSACAGPASACRQIFRPFGTQPSVVLDAVLDPFHEVPPHAGRSAGSPVGCRTPRGAAAAERHPAPVDIDRQRGSSSATLPAAADNQAVALIEPSTPRVCDVEVADTRRLDFPGGRMLVVGER